LMRILPPRVSCRALLLLVEGQKRHREETTDLGELISAPDLAEYGTVFS
jgi:hypothetical protein